MVDCLVWKSPPPSLRYFVIFLSPNKQRFEELQHDDEAQRNEYEAEVQQQHEAAHALHVRTERVRSRHGIHFHSRLIKFNENEKRFILDTHNAYRHTSNTMTI